MPHFSSPLLRQMNKNLISTSFKIYLIIYVILSHTIFLVPKFMTLNLTCKLHFLNSFKPQILWFMYSNPFNPSSQSLFFFLLISLLIACPSQLWKRHYRSLLWKGKDWCANLDNNINNKNIKRLSNFYNF